MTAVTGFDVVVCGSLHLDIVVRAPRLPLLDETVAGTGWAFACGGKGRNQAMQAAAAGARTAMIGRVGPDEFGARLLASLDQSGVDRRGVGVDPAQGSGMSIATLTPPGDYAAVIVSGANLANDPQAVAAQIASLAPLRWLVLQNEIPDAVGVAAARAARQAGGRVIHNAAPARVPAPGLGGLVDILVVNRVEATQLSGVEIVQVGNAAAAANSLARPERAVVVTLGAEGLVFVQGGEPAVTIAAEPVTAVTTHGAGDCFVGTLAARLAEGAGLHAACLAANAAAARFVSGSAPARRDIHPVSL